MKIVVTSIFLLSLLTVIATVGCYLTMPDPTWLDSLYQAVITLTTVGSRDGGGATISGKVFVIC